MLEQLKHWLGKPDAASSDLAQRLRSYPPYQAPHSGFGRQITLQQAEANLAYFKDVLPTRLKLLGTLLIETADINTATALDAPAAHAAPLTEALDGWARREWPALRTPQLAEYRRWHTTTRAGDDIVYSLLLDVAILFGEVICRANPQWRWDLDLDQDNLRDDMTSARRVVLLADPVGAAPHPFIVDVEGIVVGRLQQPTDVVWGVGGAGASLRAINPWHCMVAEAIRGDAMAAWR
jgi:hypothetical protein